jgi:hypothetical protein
MNTVSDRPKRDGPSTPRFAAVSDMASWIVSGMVLQVIGVGAPALYLVIDAHKEGLGGHISAATIRLAWRSQSHTGSGLVLLVLGALAFATGSILMARPYVRHPGALFVAVPLSALAGMLLAGAAALIVAGAIALGESWDLDVVDLFAPSGRRRKRKREHRERFD